LFTTRTSDELFVLQGVKNNYGQPQGPTIQLSLDLISSDIYQISTNLFYFGENTF